MPESALKERFEQMLHEFSAPTEPTKMQIVGAHGIAAIFCKALVALDQENPGYNPYILISEYVECMVGEQERSKDDNGQS